MSFMKKFCIELKDDFFTIKNTKLFKLGLILISFIFPLLVEKFYYVDESFSIIRYVIFTLILLFLSFNLIFNIKKMWDFIYRKRYLIGIFLFVVVVLGGFHGSSISIFNDIIEPGSNVSSSETIIGRTREIRSDEWDISSLMVLSQLTPLNELSPINKTMMGGIGSNVELFPKLPTKSLSVLLSPRCLGFLFLPEDNAFSFYWFFEYFLLFFASFEFLMLVTKKKKLLSLVGTIAIVFSAVVQWWEFTNILAYGMLAIVFFDKFLNSNSYLKKIIFSLLIGYCGVLYIMSLYPAWMVPFGYFFLGIVIWQLIDNKGKYKWKDFLLLVPIVLITIAGMLIPTILNASEVIELMSNTAYPGGRFSTGAEDLEKLFYYPASFVLPFVNSTNASETAQFLSLYPLTLIMGLYYIIKNRKEGKKDFLIPILMIVIVFLSIWNYVEIPDFLAKITLLYMSKPARTVTGVGFASCILMFVIIANYSRKIEDKKTVIKDLLLALIVLIPVLYFVKEYCSFISIPLLLVIAVLYFIIFYLFIRNDIKAKKILCIIIVLVSLCSGVLVHPLSRTVNAVYDKPIAKEIQSIVKKDPDGLWVSEFIQAANYVHANGAKTLNSTNYYPNFSLWKKIDPKGKYEKRWNRYSTLSVNIIEDKTNIKLVAADHLALNLNSDDMCKINIDYLFTPSDDRDELSNDKVEIKEIYSKENMYIYKINCN